MDIEQIDLNLLVALDVLVREQNVTRAGKVLGLSQPAMSNVLNRLRRTLDDPILIRSPGGMLPTPRAQALVSPVRKALAELSQALAESVDFDPKHSERKFRVSVVDHSSIAIVPRLVSRLEHSAPSIDVRFTPYLGSSTIDELESGRIDAAIAVVPLDKPRAGLYRRTLLEDRFVCLLRCNHPLVKKRLTLSRYTQLRHLLVSPFEAFGGGIVDWALERVGKTRRVAFTVPHFAAAPLIVSQTDLVATLPSVVAQPFTRVLPVQCYPVPVELTGGTWFLLWHERTHRDPAHAWLREQIAAVAEEASRDH